MATLVRGTRPGNRRAEKQREQDPVQSVREVCLLGTGPGEPGGLWRQGPERVAVDGREYRVMAVQKTSRGGYLHLSTVEMNSETTDR